MAIELAHCPEPAHELTYEEYLKTPEIEGPFEIIDGVLILSPAPASEHQWYSRVIEEALWAYVRGRRLGVVLHAPIDVLIRKVPKLQPGSRMSCILAQIERGFAGLRT